MSDTEKFGIVRAIGWGEFDGREGFRAIVEFPDGPPDLPFSVIWNAQPVRIVPVAIPPEDSDSIPEASRE